MSSEVELAPYQPRILSSLGRWTLHGGDFKVYGIVVTAGTTFDPDVVKVARKASEAALTNEPSVTDQPLGFIILHAGLEAVWLLVHWWTGDILRHAVLSAPLDEPSRFTPADPAVAGCVWELAVIHHEREAFVDTMMTGRPSREAYLERRLAEGEI